MNEFKVFKGTNCLVTGGTGLIGRQVADLLCDAGANVLSVSLDNLEPNPKATYLRGNLCDFDLCRYATKKMDYVFHVAGIKGSVAVTSTRPASFFVPLLMMNTNVLEACRLNGVRGIVYVSSIGAYPSRSTFDEDDSPMDSAPMDYFPGWAKRMGELQIQAYRRQYGLDNFAVVRPCSVYGPGDNFDPATAMVIPSLMAKIKRGDDPVVVWGDGSSRRDFCYSSDVARGIILVVLHGTNVPFVNLGSGEATSIRELVETMLSFMFMPFNYKFDTSKPSGYPIRVMNITRAKRLLDWEPRVTLVDGLQRTWRWFVQHPDEYKQKEDYLK